MGLKHLWVVRKSDLVVDSIGAECMLSRFLQIDNYSNIQTEHLRYDIILLHFPCAGSLRADDFVFNQVRVKPLDNWILAVTPLLFSASLAEAESALEAMLATEFLPDEQALFGLGVICNRNVVR